MSNAIVNEARMTDSASSLLNDSKLPHLSIVLDLEVMIDHFNMFLNRAGMSTEWHVQKIATEKIFFKPTKHCRILYRLTFRHASGREAEEWFYGRMLPAAVVYKRFQKAASINRPTHLTHNFLSSIPPVSFWQDFNMILWMFPHDPKLDVLHKVVDPTFVQHRLRSNVLNGLSPELEEASDDDINFSRIKYMPGKRCVVRFELNSNGSSDESKKLTFFSKTYPDSSGRFHFDSLMKIYETVEAESFKVNIPRPLIYFDNYNTFWQCD